MHADRKIFLQRNLMTLLRTILHQRAYDITNTHHLNQLLLLIFSGNGRKQQTLSPTSCEVEKPDYP